MKTELTQVLDYRSTVHPANVGADIRRLWADRELGNDHCYYSWCVRSDRWYDEEEHTEYPNLAAWIEENCDPSIPVLIHYWW